MHNRLPVAVLVIAGRLAAQSAGGVTGTVVAANMTASTVSVVDAASGRTLATYPTGEGPHEVAVSNDGRSAVVSVYGTRAAVGHSLLVIDLIGRAAPRVVELGDVRRPHGMKFLADDRQLLVTSEASQAVMRVDLGSGAVDTLVSTAQAGTHMITLLGDGSRAATTNVGAGTVSIIDVKQRAILRTISAGTRVEGIASTPDGAELWVGANDGKAVLVYNTVTGAQVARIEGFGLPYRIGITPDGATAVISDPGAERIHLVDVKQHRIRQTIDVPSFRNAAGDSTPSSPQGVTLSRDGRTAFVTLKAAGRMVIVDIATGAMTGSFAVGGGSDGVGYSPVKR